MLTDLPDEVLATPVPAETTRERQPTLDEMERPGISRKALWQEHKRCGMD